MIEPLQLLQELVSIPSTSGCEEQAVLYLVERMAGLGYRAFRDDAGNAVGVLERPDSGGRITREGVLLGHIDTVPGAIPVEIRDGCLYGRGTVDAKGPLAAFVMAAACTRLAPGSRLIVAGAVEEESATSKGAFHLMDHLPGGEQDSGSRAPDFCIIGEPSGSDAVTLGYKGRMLLEYDWSQQAGHSAGPERAAAEMAVAWWNSLQALADQFNTGKDQVFDQLTPSLRHIETGTDGLADHVHARVGIRIPPGVDLEALAGQCRTCAGEAALQVHGCIPAFREQRTSQLARIFSRVLRQQGKRPRLKVKSGTSDMNIAGPRWGCPTVAYGPGDSMLDHTPNEHLQINEYLESIKILTEVLEEVLEETK